MSDPADRTGPVYGQEGPYGPPPVPERQPSSWEQQPRAWEQQPPAWEQQPPAWQQQPPAWQQQPAYVSRPSYPRNDLAVWSLVLGALGVLGCVFFTGIPAILVGGAARRAVAAGEADNDGMATAGVVLGWVSVGLGALLLLVLLLAVLLPLLLVGAASTVTP